MQVLEVIVHIDSRARMIGNYSGPQLDLYTEKVTGTTSACLGLIQINKIYIPNSVLKEDIRSITPKPPGKIFAIFKKKNSSKFYNILTYKNQNIQITPKCLPKEIINKIENSLLDVEIDTHETIHNNRMPPE